MPPSLLDATQPLLCPDTRQSSSELDEIVATTRNKKVSYLVTSILGDSIPGESSFTYVQKRLTTTELERFLVIVSYILQNSTQTFAILVAGRLGPHELSVAAFSLMLAWVTGPYLVFDAATVIYSYFQDGVLRLVVQLLSTRWDHKRSPAVQIQQTYRFISSGVMFYYWRYSCRLASCGHSPSPFCSFSGNVRTWRKTFKCS